MFTTKRIVLLAAFVITNGFCLAVGYVVGGVMEDCRLYHSRFEQESDVLRERVLSDKRFASLELQEESKGYATLWGVVASIEDRNELETRLVRSFGDSLLDDRMYGVGVAKSATE